MINSTRRPFVAVWLTIVLMAMLPTMGHAQDPESPPSGEVGSDESPVEYSISERLGVAPPDIETVDASFLTQFVRRVFSHRFANKSAYEAGYVPSTLRDVECRVAVTLRRRGAVVATAMSETQPILESCRDACDQILALREDGEPVVTADVLKTSNLEMELVGPREFVGTGAEVAVGLAERFEPAIHGVAMLVDEKEILVRPSQILSKEVLRESGGKKTHRCDREEAVIESLQRKLGLFQEPPKYDPASISVYRFRTVHIYEPEPAAPAVVLSAGMRFVDPSEVTRDAVVVQAKKIARFIGHRQIEDGTFAYEYLPGRDLYWFYEQNWIRQAATAWAIAHYARTNNDKEASKVADRAIDAFVKMAKPVPGVAHAKFIDTPDREPALGTTALVCLAMIDAPSRDRYEALRIELLNGIASQQNPDGGFRTYFPGHSDTGSQDYYPGEALLAIAKHYTLTRDAKFRAVCDKALPFYVAYFRMSRPAMFVPWQSQAWSQMARATKLQRYADFVFEMNDIIVTSQIQFADPALAVFLGGLDVYRAGRTGISSAVYVEGLVEAARTAEVMGDHERAKAYRGVIRRAMRFVMQLCYREEECYYIRSPKEVLGGIRNSPSVPALRIDNMQHALSAFDGAVQILTDEDWQAGLKLLKEEDFVPVDQSK